MLNISCTACLHTLHNHLMSFFHCYRVGMFSYRSFVILKRSLLAYFTLMIFLLSNSILFYLTISDIVFYFTICDIELRLSSGPCFSYFSYFSLLFFICSYFSLLFMKMPYFFTLQCHLCEKIQKIFLARLGLLD